MTGGVIFAYLCAGAWLAYHNQFWDTRTVRFLVWLTYRKKVMPGHGGVPEWRGRKLIWHFPVDKPSES